MVGALGFLSPDVLETLGADAAARETSVAQLALQRGLLDAVQLDIVDTLLHPTTAVPGYELLALRGRGGMGVVYKARQLALDRPVAVKTILVGRLAADVAQQRFEQEARSVARLAHPHIIAAYDYGRSDGRVWFVMELVEGIDAQEFIRRHGRLDEWTTWGIIRQTAAGLAHACEQGFVHRDIKPANLLLVPPPAGFPLPAGMLMVKIADFGLARLTEAADGRSALTETNMTVGTPHYMPPEQLQGGDVGPHSDIFALGATAFCMLTGRPPLDGQTLPQIVASRLQGTVESLRDRRPDISPASAALVEAMMHPDRRQRPGDYRELLARIDRLGIASPAEIVTRDVMLPDTATLPKGGSPASTVTAPVPVPSSLATPRRWSSLGSGPQLLAIGALAAAMVAWAILGGRGTPPPRDLVPTDTVEPLFDGRDIGPWRTVVGGWATARNDESALVLQGKGIVSRLLAVPDAAGGRRQPAHYRISCVVDRHEADAVEMQFDLPVGTPGSADTGGRFVVRIDASGAAFGERTTDRPLRPLARRPGSEAAAPLHAVEFERHSRGWWVLVDGAVLATAGFLHDPPAAEIRFVAEGGDAWLSDVTIEELAPSPTTDRSGR